MSGSKKIIKVEIKFHAIQRIKERGGNLERAIQYLRSNLVSLTKNYQGYEIFIPFMGSLAGNFDEDVFVIKTFCPPFQLKKDYYRYGKQSRPQQPVRVTSIRLPWSVGYYD